MKARHLTRPRLGALVAAGLLLAPAAAQQLWLEWFETLKAFPPLQAPASYNLTQVMDQLKGAGHSSD